MKKLKIFLWILAALIVIGVVILTPIGKFIFKKFAEYEVNKYFPSTQIVYLDYGFNNFSVAFKNEDNKFKVFGQMLPLNAMYEGELNDVFKILKPYRGAFKINGVINSVLDSLTINGNIVLTGTGGVLQYQILKNKNIMDVKATGVDLDAKKLFYMLGLNSVNNIDGKINIEVKKKIASPYLNVDMQMRGNFYQYPIKMSGNVKFINRKQFDYTANVDTDISSNLDIVGKYNNGSWNLHYNIKGLNLKKLNLIYPFEGKMDLKGSYNSANNILKFANDEIEGAYGDNTIELGFSLNSKKFFQYIGFKEIFKADISGTARIMSKSGSFEIMGKNMIFYKNNLIDKIYQFTGINLNKYTLNKAFIKGIFNANMVVFDFLSSDKRISISVTKGKYYYNGKYEFTIFIRKNKKVYKIYVDNKTVKLLEKKNLNERNEKILIY